MTKSTSPCAFIRLLHIQMRDTNVGSPHQRTHLVNYRPKSKFTRPWNCQAGHTTQEPVSPVSSATPEGQGDSFRDAPQIIHYTTFSRLLWRQYSVECHQFTSYNNGMIRQHIYNLSHVSPSRLANHGGNTADNSTAQIISYRTGTIHAKPPRHSTRGHSECAPCTPAQSAAAHSCFVSCFLTRVQQSIRDSCTPRCLDRSHAASLFKLAGEIHFYTVGRHTACKVALHAAQRLGHPCLDQMTTCGLLRAGVRSPSWGL